MMAQGNGSTNDFGLSGDGGSGPGFGGRMKQVVGDIGRYFKAPGELSRLPGEQEPQQQQDGGGGGNGQGQQQQGKQPQGSTNKGASNDPETLENPLDVYAGLFSNAPKVDKEGKPLPAPPEAPKFKLDSKTIGEAASKMDFTAGLPPELAEKMANGETLSQAEQMQMLNHVGSRAYSHAMEHASALTDRFVEMRLTHEQQGLSTQVNKLLAKSHALNTTAIKNNPALKEHYGEMTERLYSKFPDQTPEWIADKAEQYFIDIAKAVNPELGRNRQNEPRDGTNAKGEHIKDGKVFDWPEYLK